MATVRKRKWTRNGETRTAWVLDYVDQKGRHVQTFATKKAADAALVDVGSEIRRGVHTADAHSITVGDACNLWVERGEIEGLERSTIRSYRTQADLHIVPTLGSTKLSRLTTPRCEAFKDDLLRRLSRQMATRVMTSLRMALSEAMRRGLVGQNVAREVKVITRGRDNERVKIPTKAEIKTLMANVDDRWRPLLVTATFTGLRASELRGLPWADVDLDKAVLHVTQRADRWCDLGAPKSAAGRRDVPLAPMLINTLRAWKLACPKGPLNLCFPTGAGTVVNLAAISNRWWYPLQVACGITRENGKAKYGLHALRHFAAALWLSQSVKPKTIQKWLGHSSIQVTLDTYGHLLEDDDDHVKMAAGVAQLVG